MTVFTPDVVNNLRNKMQVKAKKLINKKTLKTKVALKALLQDWKVKSVQLLSKERGTGVRRNTSLYPYMVSKQLRHSLSYRLDVKQRKYGATITIHYGFSKVERRASKNSPAFDYGTHLDENLAPYGGYRERIKSKLEKRVATQLKRFM